MKLVHLSDLHLGFRQYQRQTAAGINQREADVAAAFRRAVDKIIEVQPDLILVGGDVFHTVRPTNPAILHAYNQFLRLTEMLPDANIVIVAGNHDRPRTTETGCLLRLFSNLGITVVEDAAKHLTFRDGELSVLAIPSSIRPRPAFEPHGSARYNVMLMHDQVEGLIKRGGTAPIRPIDELAREDIRPERWDYVGLGHYHVYTELAPNAYYSGSLEYSSSNIWGEMDEEEERKVRGSRSVPGEYKGGKGFLEYDLDTGKREFHSVTLARRVIDLPPVSAVGRTAEELSAAICATVDTFPGGIDDLIVRLVVREVPRHVLRDLDHRKIREFKRRALHFLLDARRPEPVRVEASGAPGRRTSLADTVRSMLETRHLTPGIDRPSLVELGMYYLDEADRITPALTGDEV